MSENPVQKARARYVFASKKRTDGDDDQGECYELSEPQDFDAWVELLRRHELSERQSNESMLRMIEHFMDSVYKGETPRYFVMYQLANSFYEVLQGGRWENAFPLPWTKFPLHLTEIENRDLEMYCEVENGLHADPTADVTKLIDATAKRWCVSFATARGAYYGWRKQLKSNDLKNDAET